MLRTHFNSTKLLYEPLESKPLKCYAFLEFGDFKGTLLSMISKFAEILLLQIIIPHSRFKILLATRDSLRLKYQPRPNRRCFATQYCIALASLFNARCMALNAFLRMRGLRQGHVKIPNVNNFAEYEEIAYVYEYIEWTFKEGGISAAADWE